MELQEGWMILMIQLSSSSKKYCPMKIFETCARVWFQSTSAHEAIKFHVKKTSAAKKVLKRGRQAALPWANDLARRASDGRPLFRFRMGCAVFPRENFAVRPPASERASERAGEHVCSSSSSSSTLSVRGRGARGSRNGGSKEGRREGRKEAGMERETASS